MSTRVWKASDRMRRLVDRAVALRVTDKTVNFYPTQHQTQAESIRLNAKKTQQAKDARRRLLEEIAKIEYQLRVRR
jgi:hypothetical protein